MNTPTRIALPHSLGKDEVKRRLRARLGDLPGHLPGGIANVAASWPSDDRMALNVTAMGQSVDATIEVEDAQVVLNLTLPPMLSFFSGAIESGVRQAGAKLLEDKR
jgi:hypothetical protein